MPDERPATIAERTQDQIERDWLLAEADDDTRARFFAARREEASARASTPREETWTCKVGGRGVVLPPAADQPMRAAVTAAFRKLTGVDPEFVFSGWGGALTESERAVTR